MTRLALMTAALCCAFQVVAAQSVQISNSQKTIAENQVHLRALDTLNGTTTDLTLAVGEKVRFGYLEIIADTCRVPEATPKADAYAFLRIRDTRENTTRFSGWMFASSPALSALDHPRYDVWVVSCNNV